MPLRSLRILGQGMWNDMADLFAYIRLSLALTLFLALYAVYEGDPTDFVTLREQSSPEAIQAGMFAFIAAIALFLNVTYGVESKLNHAARLVSVLAGAFATSLAAWYWLDSETVGGPGNYVYPLFGLVAFFVIAMVTPVGWSLFREWRGKRKNSSEISPHTATGELRMYAEARSFLLGVGKEELIRKGVIRGAPEWLVQESKEPLIELMKERGVERLVFGWLWFLDVNGDSFNPDSDTQLFAEQNKSINPFFGKL